MLLPEKMCTVFTWSCTYMIVNMIVNIITVSVLPAFAVTTTTIMTVNNFTIKPTTAANETNSPAEPTTATNQKATTLAITTSTYDTTTASTQGTITATFTISVNATATASTHVTTSSPINTSPNATIAASTHVTTTSPITTSPTDTIVATTQVTTTSPITTSPNDTIAATTQVTTTSPITTLPNDTIAATTRVTTAAPITTAPNDTIAATTHVATTSPITTSPNDTIAATTQMATASPINTSPNDTIVATTQVSTTSSITTLPNDTITATTQGTTTSPITTSPNDTIAATTLKTTILDIVTSLVETTTSSTQATTPLAITDVSDETSSSLPQESTKLAITTSSFVTSTSSILTATTLAITSFPEETTTASIVETTKLPIITSPVETTTASTQEVTSLAMTTFPDEKTTVSTVETTTLAIIDSSIGKTTASTQDTTTLAITTSPDETTTASTQEKTTSALTISPEETTMVSTVETTTSAITTPDETTMASEKETTPLALSTYIDDLTTESTQETTKSALTTSPDVTTTVSTQETSTSALTTSPDVTTTVSTQETTTSALTTSPDVTTTVSTQETTTSALTTSPDVTTTVSTKESTTSALTTSPDVTTTESTQQTTKFAITTSPDATTTVSTQETTTSARTTFTDVKTTHNLETKTTVQLTITSSPLKVTTSTKIVIAYCPRETLKNITWLKTEAGKKDTQKCPPGYTGNIFRKCNDKGDWEDPVYIECVNMALYETTEKLDKLGNITDPTKATAVIDDVLNTINNHTNGNENSPTSGDLKHTTDILSQIVGIGTSKNATVNSEKFGDVLNSVLDRDNSGSWNEVNSEDQSDEGASKIMGIVDSLGSLVQRNLLPNETITINKTNLVIEVSTLKKNLTFPPDSNSISKLFLTNQTSLQDTLYTAALYRTLSGILPTTPNRSVGSDVISVSFDQAIDILTENITIRFEQNKEVAFTDPKISCVYWNFSARSWANSGCYLKQTESNVSTCTCDHLTNFAILMSPSDFEITDLHQRALEIITFVGCGLSILGCFLTLIAYYAFWRYVKNEWTVILSNMCVVLIIGYSVFLSSTNVTDNKIACIIVTAVLHYVFLVVFFLMLCEGISVARSVTVVFKRKSEARFYLLFAWGVPLVIVGITLGVTRIKGYHSEKYCWLSTNNFVFMAFVGPALLIILINIGIIHVVLKAIYSTHAMVNERLKKKVRAGVKCMVVLIPVLGLSWLFGILAYNEDTIIFQYLFGISTSLQGFIIFIRDAVSNKKLHEGIRKAVHRYRSKSMLKGSSKTQSSGLQNRFDFKGNQMSSDEYPYDKPMRAHLRMRTFI